MTPMDKRCSKANKEAWLRLSAFERSMKLNAAKKSWTESYTPPVQLKTEITADDLGGDFELERGMVKMQNRGAGGMDSIILETSPADRAQITLLPPGPGLAASSITMADGGALHDGMLIFDGYLLWMVGGVRAHAMTTLQLHALGGSQQLLFLRPDPLCLGQGWAMQQPNIRRTPLTLAQYVFLIGMIERPGKLPSDHIQYKMCEMFEGRKDLIMKGRRVKEFVTRYLQMKKNNALTATVRSAVECLAKHDTSNGIGAAVASAQAITIPGNDDDDDDGDNGDGDDEVAAADEVAPTAAPRAKRGFLHADGVSRTEYIAIGTRLQYRTPDDVWFAGVVKMHQPVEDGMRYKVHCENHIQYEGIALRAAEHGPSKRWVSWKLDLDLAARVPGDATYAVLEIAPGETALPEPPPREPAAMKLYATQRVREAKKNEVIYYNWCQPVDWQRGTVLNVCGEKTRPKDSDPNIVFVKVKFDVAPGEPRGSSASVSLNPAQYGIRGRWFIATKDE
jgi:hypothetical protein